MRDQHGFTLVELLVAMAVFSFVLLIIVIGFMNIVSIHNAALASNQAQDSVRSAMDQMVQGVRDSTGVQTLRTGVAPGVTGALGSNFDVMCLNNASGGPREYFVAGTPRQLWVRNGICDAAPLTSPPAATDTPMTSTGESVEAFKVKQIPDPSVTGLPTGWKPEVQMTIALGSANGTTTPPNGILTACNANAADRAFCSTAVLTSGASPR
jgi:prepilin-type N-terminal cleavage/methylation domain-containing protein